MQKFLPEYKAFTLIEVSIIIIIIGILVSGISSGMDLYEDYKITTARNLTLNSRVKRIDDLEVWLETTNENAFSYYNTSVVPNRYDFYKNISENQPIQKWNNVETLNKLVNGNDVIQTTLSKQPKYISNSIGGLPALYFDGKNDGTGDSFLFNGSFLNNKTDVTVFIVDQRTALGTPSVSPSYSIPYQYFLSGNDSVNFAVGYSGGWVRISPSNLNWTGFSNVLNIPHIFTFQSGNDDGSKIFMDGELKVSSSANAVISIGNGILNICYFNRSWTQNWYTGFIGEIIIFSRSLNSSERMGVEEYLSKKWKIKIN